MSAATSHELLHPLALFRRNGGQAAPTYEVIKGLAVPEPYFTLLVHHGDMTSKLEEFHGSRVNLEVLHREHGPAAYRREVVLHLAKGNLAVEYGAIEIELDAFTQKVRDEILAERQPLGGLLNEFGVTYRSEPKAFIKLAEDPVMQRVFSSPNAVGFYGRCNRLLGANGETLARIVEILRPVNIGPAYPSQ